MQLSPPFSTGEAAAQSSQVAFPELPWSIAVHSEEKFIMCHPNAPITRPETGNIFKSEYLQVSSQEQLCCYLLAKREMIASCLLSARWAK